MQLTNLTDPVELTRQMIDIPSVSGDEGPLADAVEAALLDAGFGSVPSLEILRDGDAVCVRTCLGLDQRVILAGHLDTVPIADNVPGRFEERDGATVLWGRGSVDMLGGCAAALALACEAGAVLRSSDEAALNADVTWVFYDHEEVASHLNGLGRVQRNHPEWLVGDLALLGEPTAAHVEGGCNGTLRVIAHFSGRASHSARAWMGVNAIHAMAPVIERIATYGNPVVTVDGLDFRESLSVVRVAGGIANNVIPEAASMTVNYRFAPSTRADDALEWVRGFFEGTGATIEVDDLCEGARPGADSDVAQRFLSVARQVAASRGEELQLSAKVGWTDVARFTQVGVPAMNFGPGDPLLAHTRDEHTPVSDIVKVHGTLRAFVLAQPAPTPAPHREA